MSAAVPSVVQGPGSEIAGSCDIGTLNKLKEEHKGGFFLIVSQKGCADCDEMKAVLKEVVQDKKPVVDADLTEDKTCVDLAEQLGDGITPTVHYFEEGKELAKIVPDGAMTWDQVRGKVREMVNRPPVAAVSIPAPPIA